MVVHEAVGVAQPSEAVGDLRQDGEKAAPVVIMAHDLLPSIATTRDMVDGMRKFNA